MKVERVLDLYRVYDKRTNKTLFEAVNNIDCGLWMGKNIQMDSEDFDYVWMEKVNQQYDQTI